LSHAWEPKNYTFLGVRFIVYELGFEKVD
jgi:hypothetical protein